MYHVTGVLVEDDKPRRQHDVRRGHALIRLEQLDDGRELLFSFFSTRPQDYLRMLRSGEVADEPKRIAHIGGR